MRACLFAAVSTEEQSDPLLPSLDSQLAACERFVSGQEGWQVVERIRVEGHSRYYSRLDRLCQDSERYRRLVALIEDKACDVVVCYSYDRLWRKAALQGQLCALADDAGVWLYSISQPTQRGQEQVNLWLHAVYGVSAQQEIINLRDRRNRGMAGRIQRRGLHGSTWAPYGYRWQSALGEQGDLSSPALCWSSTAQKPTGCHGSTSSGRKPGPAGASPNL